MMEDRWLSVDEIAAYLRDQAGHGLQVDRKKADAGTPDGAPAEVPQGGGRQMGQIRRGGRVQGRPA